MKTSDWIDQARLGYVQPIPKTLQDFLDYNGFVSISIFVCVIIVLIITSYVLYYSIKKETADIGICLGCLFLFLLGCLFYSLSNVLDIYYTPTHYLLRHTEDLKYLMK